MANRIFVVARFSILFAGMATWGPAWAQNALPLSPEVRQSLDKERQKLRDALESARRESASVYTDAAIFDKGLTWGLDYDREFTPADLSLLRKGVTRGLERAAALRAGKLPWQNRRGTLALGYVSRVDGSVQPYGVVVPRDYDPRRPIRLDVVLHGSTRPVGMTELRFIARFDQGDEPNEAPDAPRAANALSNQPFIELHPLGRVENCYRWAGETDVFEAIDDVCRRYNIDRDRIVLRGMSMGASGTWHLGLKHPDRFVALGPYCGYVDTHRFSQLPFAHFVKVGELPAHQESGLRMLDSIDYAANAGVVPAIACMGEKDEAFEAHVLMAEAMRREGLQMVNLISPGTGHVIDPVTHAEQMRLIGAFARVGLDHAPRSIRFVTWTLKYSRCHWLRVLGLERHYTRAVLAARHAGDTIEFDQPINITRFAIETRWLSSRPRVLKIGMLELPVPREEESTGPLVVERGAGGWRIAGRDDSPARTGKRPGLQGPIDDAFTEPFLCVRGTGQPWHPAVQAHAEASVKRFAAEWRQYFRGDLPIKDDTNVTESDVQAKNLILFGDPGSNAWIARALPHLPLKWTKETLRLAGHDYPAADHLPALIAPNPLPGGDGRYVVLNSGHTFRESELSKLNYLLFPRWGDWAVLKIDATPRVDEPLIDTVLQAGYFDESWRAPE
jgi:pimeloyl-ACP methyl ester carboxylesterase